MWSGVEGLEFRFTLAGYSPGWVHSVRESEPTTGSNWSSVYSAVVESQFAAIGFDRVESVEVCALEARLKVWSGIEGLKFRFRLAGYSLGWVLVSRSAAQTFPLATEMSQKSSVRVLFSFSKVIDLIYPLSKRGRLTGGSAPPAQKLASPSRFRDSQNFNIVVSNVISFHFFFCLVIIESYKRILNRLEKIYYVIAQVNWRRFPQTSPLLVNYVTSKNLKYVTSSASQAKKLCTFFSLPLIEL